MSWLFTKYNRFVSKIETVVECFTERIIVDLAKSQAKKISKKLFSVVWASSHRAVYNSQTIRIKLFPSMISRIIVLYELYTENPAYRAPMLIGPFLKFPRYKAPCQYIRSHLMNRNFKCKICGIYFLHNIFKKVSGCPLMYLTMPFLDKILLWNVNFVAFWRSQSSHLPRLRVPLDTGRPFLGCPVRGFYCTYPVGTSAAISRSHGSTRSLEDFAWRYSGAVHIYRA